MRTRKSILDVQGEVLRQLAIALARNSLDVDASWLESLYQFCYDNRDSGVERIVVKGTEGRCTISPIPHEISELLATLDDLRPMLPNSNWWGISVHVTRTGDVDVQYDYDPDCIERFFEDEKAHRPF